MSDLEQGLIIALSLVSLGLLISVVFNLAFIASAIEDSRALAMSDLELWVEKAVVKEEVLQC